MPEWQLTTPVVLFIFKRAELTDSVFKVIRQARPEKLFVIADGPRSQIDGELEACIATRAKIDAIDWNCEVLTNYSEVNLGCKQRIVSGLDWVFGQVEDAIILEDDCLPHPDFFRFCQDMLALYRHDERIAIIRGDNWPGGGSKWNESFHFSIYPSTWGWATWRRVWKNFDAYLSSWRGDCELPELTALLGTRTMALFWIKAFEGIDQDGKSIWDLHMVYSCWRNRQLSIVPKVNLISNIGGGEDATHTTESIHFRLARPLAGMSWPLVLPERISPDLAFDQRGELRAARVERLGRELVGWFIGLIYKRFYH